MKTMTPEQQARSADPTAAAIRAEIAAAEERAQEAEIASYLTPGEDKPTGDASTAAGCAVGHLRSLLACHVAWGTDPVKRLREDAQTNRASVEKGDASDPVFRLACAAAYDMAANCLEIRVSMTPPSAVAAVEVPGNNRNAVSDGDCG